MNSTNRRRALALPETVEFCALILLSGLLLVLAAVPFTQNGKNAQRDGKPFITGIDNFGQVDEHLYRGAQPKPAAYAQLKKMGIDTVVRFNSEGHEDMASEKAQVESLGMRFVGLPWSTSGEPSHEQVVTLLALLRANHDGKTFVHCRVGADRTGVMVALYRLAFSHWNTAQALEEMRAFHYHPLFLPHLQRYVESFPAAMASDKDLQPFDQPIASLAH
jgi:protein tyrosine/serine phosphatase